MTSSFSITTEPAGNLRKKAAALLLALALPFEAYTQAPNQPPPGPPREYSDAVNNGFAELGKLLTPPENWELALAKVLELEKAGHQGESFDQANLKLMESKIRMTTNHYPLALEPMRTAVEISDKYPGMLSRTDKREAMKYLAQIYQFLATAEPNQTEAQKKENLAKSVEVFERYLQAYPTDVSDLYQYATILVPSIVDQVQKPTPETIKKFKDLVHEALLRRNEPSKEFYRFQVLASQVEGDLVGAADGLELLVSLNPGTNESEFLKTLSALYVGIAYTAAEAKDQEKADLYNLRTIYTIQRAQSKVPALLNSSTDNLNLVQAYMNLGLVEQGAELMEACLKKGTIEPTEMNWTYVANYYQRVNEDQKAIDVLKSAAGSFPNSGQFDYQISNAYFALDNIPEALKYAKIAIEKKVPGKTGEILLTAAYYAFTLDHYEEAAKYVADAEKTPEGRANINMAQLKQAIEDALHPPEKKP